jgi:hypothetical protein
MLTPVGAPIAVKTQLPPVVAEGVYPLAVERQINFVLRVSDCGKLVMGVLDVGVAGVLPSVVELQRITQLGVVQVKLIGTGEKA